MSACQPKLNLCLLTWDPGAEGRSLHQFVSLVIERVRAAWADGADLVLLPELLWMGLEPLIPSLKPSALHAVATHMRDAVLPVLQRELAQEGKAVLLGSAPHLTESGTLRNRAHLLCEGRWLHQDKLQLTPWEHEMEAGQAIRLWHWRGWRVATLICLDIEVPELAASLRSEAVDLILCPSATETELGVERVNRCASARAVELACFVAVSALTGAANSQLIDSNVGRCALYSPSQQAFAEGNRQIQGPLLSQGVACTTATLDHRRLDAMRSATGETNPSRLQPHGQQPASRPAIHLEDCDARHFRS